MKVIFNSTWFSSPYIGRMCMWVENRRIVCRFKTVSAWKKRIVCRRGISKTQTRNSTSYIHQLRALLLVPKSTVLYRIQVYLLIVYQGSTQITWFVVDSERYGLSWLKTGEHPKRSCSSRPGVRVCVRTWGCSWYARWASLTFLTVKIGNGGGNCLNMSQRRGFQVKKKERKTSITKIV